MADRKVRTMMQVKAPDSGKTPPRVGVVRASKGRITGYFAACDDCDPRWLEFGHTKKKSQQMAMLHALEVHKWSPAS